MEEKAQYSLEDLMKVVNQLCQDLQNLKKPLEITPDLQAAVDKLVKYTSDFKEDLHDVFETIEVDIKSLQNEVLVSDDLRSSDKQLIKQAKDAELEARVMKAAVEKSGKGKRKKSGSSITGGDSRLMKERKKMFKSIGGDQKWIPL